MTTTTFLDGNFAPVTEEVTVTELAVSGTVPPELAGRLVRIGPNPATPPDPATYHWFLGDGMVHGVRLRDGRAERLTAALAGFDLVYFSGITLSILAADERPMLCRLVETLRARGARIAFDSNFRRAGWPDLETARATFDDVLRRTDIALPTLGDEQELFGVATAEDCAERLHRLGVAEVVVKLGPHGCYASTAEFTGRVPAEPVARVVDSTAAGDSLNAGYLAARLLGHHPEAAARLGNKVAARVISHPGAVIPAAAMTDLRV